jgi:hypothetical protein
MEQLTAQCRCCNREFKYPDRGRKREVCDSCKRLPILASNKRLKQERAKLLQRAPADSQARAKSGLPFYTQDQIAYALGITAEMVYEDERRALAKLRKHPELLDLLARVREEGIPVQPDVGAQVLEWQMGLLELWRVHDELLTRQEVEAAAQCRTEIEKFQSALSDFLNR